jgi:hypothetical protein
MTQLNGVYRSQPALHAVDFSWEGFEWIDLHDQDNSLLSFMRKGKSEDELVVCAFNFTPVPRASYRLGVPRAGAYEQILNSDADEFGGSNAARLGVVQAEEKSWHNQKFSIGIALPPLGAVYFRFKPAPKIARVEEKVDGQNRNRAGYARRRIVCDASVKGGEVTDGSRSRGAHTAMITKLLLPPPLVHELRARSFSRLFRMTGNPGNRGFGRYLRQRIHLVVRRGNVPWSRKPSPWPIWVPI